MTETYTDRHVVPSKCALTVTGDVPPIEVEDIRRARALVRLVGFAVWGFFALLGGLGWWLL